MIKVIKPLAVYKKWKLPSGLLTHISETLTFWLLQFILKSEVAMFRLPSYHHHLTLATLNINIYELYMCNTETTAN